MQQPPFLQNQVVVLLQVQSIENKTALPAFTYKANTWLLSVRRKCNFFLSRSGFNIRYFSDLEKNSWSLPSTELSTKSPIGKKLDIRSVLEKVRISSDMQLIEENKSIKEWNGFSSNLEDT